MFSKHFLGAITEKFRSPIAGRSGYATFIALLLCLGISQTHAAESLHESHRGVIYARRDSEKLAADVYVPRGKGRFPAVLVVHGGAWMSGERSHLGGIAKRLADHGYTAMTISYRLAPEHKFPAQLEDCRDAVLWMRRQAERYKIDPKRIGGYGYSAGGHLVALLAASQTHRDANPKGKPADTPLKLSARLQAVVAGGTPCDFRPLPEDNRSLAYWLGGSRAEFPQVYRQASPASFVSAKCPPMFFFHGEKDRLVPLLSPRMMHQSLQAAGVSTELYVVAEKSHFGAIRDKQAATKALEFLDSILKPRRKTQPRLPQPTARPSQRSAGRPSTKVP